MTTQVDEFLEHHGIPGMKWGKRKKSHNESTSSSKGGGNSGGSGKGNAPAATTPVAKPKMSRNKKIAIGVGIGAVVAIGAAVALSSMNKNMNVPVNSLNNNQSVAKGLELVKSLSKKAPQASTPAPAVHIPSKPASNSGGTGLTLRPRSAPSSSGGASTTLSPSRSTSTPSYPRSMGGMTGAPSMNTMANLINGGPQISFNSKTGRYETG